MKLPVELCIYALQNKLLKPFRLYILLLSATQGNIAITEKDMEAIALALNYKSQKSINNNLKKLISLGWIGHDKKRKKYWIRGLDELRKRLKLKKRRSVDFTIEYLDNFDAFCFAAAIGKEWKYQKWRGISAWDLRGQAYPNLLRPSDYLPIAGNDLVKILKISKSSVSRYKKHAQGAGYIDIKSSNRTVKIRPDELRSFKSHDNETYGKMYVVGDTVVEPGIDKIKPLLTYSRRKKVKPY
ncbi:MAG: hypothetical protein GX126_00505 [Bacteroidales bacterium]|nr:hypothetical protein [Bacteroidales bacterium]